MWLSRAMARPLDWVFINCLQKLCSAGYTMILKKELIIIKNQASATLRDSLLLTKYTGFLLFCKIVLIRKHMLTFNFLSYTRTKASKDSIEKACLSKHYYAEDALIISFIRDENEVSPQHAGAIFTPKGKANLSTSRHIHAHTSIKLGTESCTGNTLLPFYSIALQASALKYSQS